MRVKVRLFARLRDLAGTDELTGDLPEKACVADVWQWLSDRCPAVAVYRSSVSAAVNAEYARMHDPVSEGDEVAFLPPVSGGER